jgi:hypothetical protein
LKKILWLALLSSSALAMSADADRDLPSLAALIMKSPDLKISGRYELPARSELLDKLLGEPLLLMRLWKAYRFSPRYEALPIESGGLLVRDPTGIAGEVFPAGLSEGGRVFVASGAIDHRLVPSVKGQAVFVIAATSGKSSVGVRLDLYVRMENRFVGFIMQPFVPFLRGLVLRRLASNVADMSAILGDLSVRPRAAAARLAAEDSAFLLALISTP